jgi:hypothetical protein
MFSGLQVDSDLWSEEEAVDLQTALRLVSSQEVQEAGVTPPTVVVVVSVPTMALTPSHVGQCVLECRLEVGLQHLGASESHKRDSVFMFMLKLKLK